MNHSDSNYCSTEFQRWPYLNDDEEFLRYCGMRWYLDNFNTYYYHIVELDTTHLIPRIGKPLNFVTFGTMEWSKKSSFQKCDSDDSNSFVFSLVSSSLYSLNDTTLLNSNLKWMKNYFFLFLQMISLKLYQIFIVISIFSW